MNNTDGQKISQCIFGLLSRAGVGKFLDLLDRLSNHLCQLLVDLLEMPLVAGVGGAERTACLGAGVGLPAEDCERRY